MLFGRSKLFKRFVIWFFVVQLSVVITVLFDKPVHAQDAGFETCMIRSDWKTKFPFDMVFPYTPPYPTLLSEESTCPTIPIFGETYEVCSLLTLTKTAKWIIVLRMVMNAIFFL